MTIGGKAGVNKWTNTNATSQRVNSSGGGEMELRKGKVGFTLARWFQQLLALLDPYRVQYSVQGYLTKTHPPRTLP